MPFRWDSQFLATRPVAQRVLLSIRNIEHPLFQSVQRWSLTCLGTWTRLSHASRRRLLSLASLRRLILRRDACRIPVHRSEFEKFAWLRAEFEIELEAMSEIIFD